MFAFRMRYLVYYILFYLNRRQLIQLIWSLQPYETTADDGYTRNNIDNVFTIISTYLSYMKYEWIHFFFRLNRLSVYYDFFHAYLLRRLPKLSTIYLLSINYLSWEHGILFDRLDWFGYAVIISRIINE